MEWHSVTWLILLISSPGGHVGGKVVTHWGTHQSWHCLATSLDHPSYLNREPKFSYIYSNSSSLALAAALGSRQVFRAECLCAFKIHMLKLNPQCDGVWKWGLWEVIRLRWDYQSGALMMELVPLWEKEDRFYSLHVHALRKGYLNTQWEDR